MDVPNLSTLTMNVTPRTIGAGTEDAEVQTMFEAARASGNFESFLYGVVLGLRSELQRTQQELAGCKAQLEAMQITPDGKRKAPRQPPTSAPDEGGVSQGDTPSGPPRPKSSPSYERGGASSQLDSALADNSAYEQDRAASRRAAVVRRMSRMSGNANRGAGSSDAAGGGESSNDPMSTPPQRR